MIKSKIEDYTIQVNVRDHKIAVKRNDKQWLYSIKLFRRDGMMLFPKPLYKLICSDIKNANIYDKFLDKFYRWWDDDED